MSGRNPTHLTSCPDRPGIVAVVVPENRTVVF
jgi:hypothetical protein